MTSSDRVRALCKEKRIPLARLEKDLGFSNASVAGTKGDIRSDRLKKIADYLEVSIEYLITGEESSLINLSPDDARVLARFALDPTAKEMIDRYMYLQKEDKELVLQLIRRLSSVPN